MPVLKDDVDEHYQTCDSSSTRSSGSSGNSSFSRYPLSADGTVVKPVFVDEEKQRAQTAEEAALAQRKIQESEAKAAENARQGASCLCQTAQLQEENKALPLYQQQ
jgi:hypothetical protein